jgi:hypothetical protein
MNIECFHVCKDILVEEMIMSQEEIMIKQQDLTSLLTLNGFFDLLGQDMNQIINFLRFMEDERATHLIEVYDALSARERSKLDLDKLADKAGYSKKLFRSILISALIEYEIDCTKLLVTLSLPRMVEKSLIEALGDEPSSYEERKEWLRYYGYFR